MADLNFYDNKFNCKKKKKKPTKYVKYISTINIRPFAHCQLDSNIIHKIICPIPCSFSTYMYLPKGINSSESFLLKSCYGLLLYVV